MSRKQIIYIILQLILISKDLSFSASKQFNDSGRCDYSDYIDYIRSGYRESKFESVAYEYVNQSLGESALVNLGFFILEKELAGIKLRVISENESLDFDLNNDQTKAFLTALARQDLSLINIPCKREQNDIVCMIIFKLSDSMFDRYFKYSILDDVGFLNVSTYMKDACVIINKYNYEKEMLEVVKNFWPARGTPFTIMADNALNDISGMNIEENIIKRYQCLNYDNLIEMFDFVRSSWDKPLVVDNTIELSLERSRALTIAMVRMRLIVDGLYNKNAVKTPDGEMHYYMTDPVYSFKCSFPEIGKYELSVQNNSKGVVGVKSLNSDDDIKKALISDGVYYSPELYNVVLSVFGEIIRKDIIETPSKKQEAKAE